MPIYEYKCDKCGHSFELLHLPGRKEEARCPQCGGIELTKLVSAPFLPSSVGRPANEEPASCCGSTPDAKDCNPGSCCGKGEGEEATH